MNIKIDISLCRVCLKEKPGVNIYTGNILEKFLYTTLVQVEKNDGLSEIICKQCLARLQTAFDFKKEAVASNRELRSFISNVNKQFLEVTGSNNVFSKLKRKQKDGESESYDELEDDICMSSALIEDEIEYKEIDVEFEEDTKKTIDRAQLVEILGDNINVRKTRSATIQEDASNETHENMEMYLVDEANDVESGYIVDEYDQSSGELITDEIDEAQYLEDDDTDDQLYEPEASVQMKRTTQRSPKSSSNPKNRCNVCNKTFSTRTNLTRHKITHEGRKPYVCKICGSSFTQNGSLKCHMFIHTGERPFKCDVCDKAFTQSKSLVFHKRRHTGEKPFPCEICGIQFRQKDGLKRHRAAKHAPGKSRNHICHVCGKILLSKHSLNTHMNRHSARELEKLDNPNSSNYIKIANVRSENDDKLRDSETNEDWDELYACECCDHAFSNSNELLEHRESHIEAQ